MGGGGGLGNSGNARKKTFFFSIDLFPKYSRARGQILPISLVYYIVQAKITLGLNASADLNEITEETIHKHFMAKLQLVSESSQKKASSGFITNNSKPK